MISDSLERLSKLHPKLIDLSLNRMVGLLEKFDNPHLRLPPTFHVAGTNGKGSTCAFLRAILEAAGKTVHVYSSPHLVKFNERLRVAGKIVDDDMLASILEEVERVNDNQPITQFEITTIAGFLLFSRIPADYLILEVGLGGRLDATNVIERPLMSVITPVSIDHQDYLGATLELIAVEKAGIMKRGRRVTIAPQTPLVASVLENQARVKRATITTEWNVRQEHGRLVYQDEQGLLDLPAPALKGAHQFVNAGTAIAALRHSIEISDEAIEKGLTSVIWAARMQHLHGKLTNRGHEIWLDGGHNEAGGEALALELTKLEARDLKPTTMIVGMINTKKPIEFLKWFKSLSVKIVAIPFEYPAALAPEIILQAASDLKLKALIENSLNSAIENTPTDHRILICGSLYLAGEVLKADGYELS